MRCKTTNGIGCCSGGNFDGKTWSELAVMIRRFHFELINRLMKKLEAVREGDGTMLDKGLDQSGPLPELFA